MKRKKRNTCDTRLRHVKSYTKESNLSKYHTPKNKYIYSPNLEWFLIFPTQRSCFGSTNCCDPLRQHRGLCLKSSNFHSKIFFLHAPRLITTTCDTRTWFFLLTRVFTLTHSLTFFSFFLLLLGNLQSH